MILAVNWTNVAIQTCMGLGVVFTVLILLVLVLKLFGFFFAEKKPAAKVDPEQANSRPTPENVLRGQRVSNVSEADKAAIAMALHLYFNAAHDTESYRLTIRHNPATAWNNKIFGINNLTKD